MAQFTIRVELHKATWSDYTTLASLLAAKHITDVLPLSDGTQWKMPPGEYQCHGELTPVQVHDIVAGIVKTLGRGYAILVTKSDGIHVSGTASQ